MSLECKPIFCCKLLYYTNSKGGATKNKTNISIFSGPGFYILYRLSTKSPTFHSQHKRNLKSVVFIHFFFLEFTKKVLQYASTKSNKQAVFIQNSYNFRFKLQMLYSASIHQHKSENPKLNLNTDFSYKM